MTGSATPPAVTSRSVRGPVVVVVVLVLALGVGLAAGLWMRGQRPHPGAFLDVVAIPNGVVAIRAERSGSHAFAELWTDGFLQWRGLIPTYRGSPGALGVRVTPSLVSIRVERGGALAHFDLDRASGVKRASGALSPADDAAAFPPPGGALPIEYEAATRSLRTPESALELPAGTAAPQPYHADGDRLWLVSRDQLTAVSLPSLRVIAVIR